MDEITAKIITIVIFWPPFWFMAAILKLKQKFRMPYRLFRKEGSCEQESGEKILTHLFLSFFGQLTCLLDKTLKFKLLVSTENTLLHEFNSN